MNMLQKVTTSFYIYNVFFMRTKVFVHLTHLKLPQISKKYLKIFVWLTLCAERVVKTHKISCLKFIIIHKINQI